jgi:hypothetical protein
MRSFWVISQRAWLGRLDEAADAIKRAIARAEHGGESLYHAELIRLRGELLLRRSADTHTPEAEDCFRSAGSARCKSAARDSKIVDVGRNVAGLQPCIAGAFTGGAGCGDTSPPDTPFRFWNW